MNKYQEALNKTNFILRKLSGWSGKDLSEIDNQYDLFNNQALIQELVDKEIELQSRKEKLVVGSEWECIARCNGMEFTHIKGTIVRIENTNGDLEVLIKPLNNLEDYMFDLDPNDVVCTDQFLLCFKPR